VKKFSNVMALDFTGMKTLFRILMYPFKKNNYFLTLLKMMRNSMKKMHMKKRFMRKVIKYMKKNKNHIMNILNKKTWIKHIMLKIESMMKTLLKRESFRMKMRNW